MFRFTRKPSSGSYNQYTSGTSRCLFSDKYKTWL